LKSPLKINLLKVSVLLTQANNTPHGQALQCSVAECVDNSAIQPCYFKTFDSIKRKVNKKWTHFRTVFELKNDKNVLTDFTTEKAAAKTTLETSLSVVNDEAESVVLTLRSVRWSYVTIALKRH